MIVEDNDIETVELLELLFQLQTLLRHQEPLHQPVGAGKVDRTAAGEDQLPGDGSGHVTLAPARQPEGQDVLGTIQEPSFA